MIEVELKLPECMDCNKTMTLEKTSENVIAHVCLSCKTMLVQTIKVIQHSLDKKRYPKPKVLVATARQGNVVRTLATITESKSKK